MQFPKRRKISGSLNSIFLFLFQFRFAVVGAFLANITAKLLIYLKVDDAVGATCVHGFGGAWGMIAVGIFARDDPMEGFNIYPGLIHGGGFYLLGIQTLTCVCLIIWSSTVTIILIFV